MITDRLDAFQRRHPVLGLPIAVVYKFAEDQGGYLAVIITYYAFVSVVPLLLLATSVLGFLLQGDPELQQRVLDSAVSRFPIVGDQLGRPEGLQGSNTAVVVGAAAVVGSSAGEASAMNQTFGVVLGLVATAYAASLALLLGVELNVVLERNLWPRALLTPFTDDVDLTPGDQRAYAGYVRAQRHKGFQYVVTRFKQRD